MTTALEAALWPPGPYRTFVVVDGAAVETLFDQLYAAGTGPEYCCLWPGDLAADMACVAPYLVALEARSGFSQWFLSGWGKHWGVALVCPRALALTSLASHLRRFNMILVPGGHAPAYFRWYDPRVLREYAASAAPGEVDALFGPAERIVVEAEAAEQCAILLPSRAVVR